MTISLAKIHTLAILVRLGLLVYGEWQDRNLNVKYTDVDYHVFTDAAGYVAQGKSPYMRPTYRYSPLLAWMLVPCHSIHIIWGKMVFIAADLITGHLIGRIMTLLKRSQIETVIAVALWLFNPLTMNISSRGNAESLMSLLVIGTLYSLHKKQTVLSAILFSLSVHFKVYPIIYALPIYLFLGSGYDNCEAEITLGMLLSKFSMKNLIRKCLSKKRLKFFVTALLSFSLITLFFYRKYGFEFLEHSYLYHVKRKDIRHNFSVYFYMLYTSTEWWLGLLCFLNQLIVVVFLSFSFYKDISFCCFLLTFSFVTFNKVCTSQYFIWYLTLLPLTVSSLKQVGKKEVSFVTSAWITTQSVWLACAYALEFQAKSVFSSVWAASVLFFMTNVCIVLWFIVRCVPSPTFLNNGQVNASFETKEKLS